MYFSAKHIDVKLNQDYADFSIDDKLKSLVLCDGIGEFKDSRVYSEMMVNLFIKEEIKEVSSLLENPEYKKLLKSVKVGGTTFISAINSNNNDKVKIEYLGNGGVIHLHGDFATNVNSNEPYRYGDIMMPHIAPNGALTKHISHSSQETELKSSTIELNLNYITGDIVLLYSDGISSVEDKVILQDSSNRFWRNENPAIQFILKELDLLLKLDLCSESFQEALNIFIDTTLGKLKSGSYLEDDASLGIIITENVLNHYKVKIND